VGKIFDLEGDRIFRKLAGMRDESSVTSVPGDVFDSGVVCGAEYSWFPGYLNRVFLEVLQFLESLKGRRDFQSWSRVKRDVGAGICFGSHRNEWLPIKSEGIEMSVTGFVFGLNPVLRPRFLAENEFAGLLVIGGEEDVDDKFVIAEGPLAPRGYYQQEFGALTCKWKQIRELVTRLEGVLAEGSRSSRTALAKKRPVDPHDVSVPDPVDDEILDGIRHPDNASIGARRIS
jgi:hypothetical protein